ncbi:MAG: hypothetical protein IJW77_03660 [Clostridia bacterium]|nr:hypothetical protein [Clostridia bacterium]
MFTIHTNFCGGNAELLSVTEDTVVFTPELRDTEGDWFYWAFCVRGAQGRTVHFTMAPKYWVGYFGAAVSHDLYHWNWSGDPDEGHTGFTYTFGEDESCVYFAHDMLYHPSRFSHLCERLGIPITYPVTDRGGTPLPMAVIGEGEHNILLTARHHCCEATGDYMMEGILTEFAENPIPGCRITAIPFVDADGVVRGDQGKNRRPHDHNRDYADGLYPGVRLVKDIVGRGDTVCAFDLHSPWHFGGSNDKLFIVHNSNTHMTNEFIRFGQILHEIVADDPGAMLYDTKNDMPIGESWNQPGPINKSNGAWCGSRPGVKIAFSFETTYFGEFDNVVTQDKLVETGRCFCRAIRQYFTETGVL